MSVVTAQMPTEVTVENANCPGLPDFPVWFTSRRSETRWLGTDGCGEPNLPDCYAAVKGKNSISESHN